MVKRVLHEAQWEKGASMFFVSIERLRGRRGVQNDLKKNRWVSPMANPAIKKGEIFPQGYLKRRLYTKEVEYLGQVVTESDNANAHTGMARIER